MTAGYQWTGAAGWTAAAGWMGLALGLVALYTALALELEDTRARTVLPVGRRGVGAPSRVVRPIRPTCRRSPGSARNCEAGLGG